MNYWILDRVNWVADKQDPSPREIEVNEGLSKTLW